MKLMNLIIISFIFLLVSAKFSSGGYDCPVEIERCRKDGPEIRFPFWLKDRHPEQCGYPGFDLYCSKSKETVLDQTFPVKVKLIVEMINYKSQEVFVSTLGTCFPGQFPRQNLSATSPFESYYNNNNYTDDYSYFSCSSNRNYEYQVDPIPCLSTFDYYVYATKIDKWSVGSLTNCTKMFSSSILPYQGHGRTYYPLLWTKPSCGHCEMEGKYCRLKNRSSIHDEIECFTKQLVPGVPKKKIVTEVVLGSVLMVLFIVLLHQINLLKKKKGDEKRIEQFLEDHRASRPSRYTYADIKKITDDFKEKLGKGGFGTVYKGKLSSDVLIAVKVLDSFKGNGEDFVNEVATIGRIHHVNVVRLLGYCADGCKRGLVYEFLPNDSLEKFISSGNRSCSLGWEKMQEIAIGIAKGLDYLHQGCNQRILHFDIKPHNILLDQNFNPKVADFGLAKLCSKEESIVSMTAARGTIGYIAPEVFSRNYGNVTCKADIYSFGMLLIDMVGGRKNFHASQEDDSQVYFPEWMYNQLEKGEEISIEIDKEEDNKIFKKLVIVGLWCIQWYPAGRPSLKTVIQMIERDEIPIMPPNPFESTKSTATNASVFRGKFFKALEVISEAD